ncbi:protein PHYTOCHROME-DEPENDENT LATE-FLOWERING-like [Silene latifolia]|uniref:protein PHYTOCHROME-DEPENDENT LATE-FLOWERING-like n=1 Tax=Silene latifolia TaxID=37657 RepID=UPI003D76DBE4
MGVSFKISRTSTRRHKPKPMITESTQFNENTDNSFETSKSHFKDQTNGNGEDAVGLTGSSVSSGKERTFGDDEVSFSLNLYPDGYSIVKASENDIEHTFKDGLKLLRPYDRTSEGLFSAIESGRLPGGILDDIPCKFVEGAIMCEVRDYRKCVPHCGPNISSPSESAIVSKVSLKMSLENIVKDIPLMADDSWTYGDLMEVESRILNALQPKLCLDPLPRLDRLCQNPASKIDLGIVGMRKKRLRQIPEVTVTSNNRSYGKKICIGHASESSIYGDIMSQHDQENVLSQGTTNQRTIDDPSQGPVLPHGVSSAGQNIPIPYANDMNLSATAKMVNQESQLPTYSNFNKRGRLASSEPDGLQHQQDGSFMDGFQRSDMQWRNPMLQPHQNASGVQYGNPGMKYPQLVGEGVTTMDGMKLEKAEPNMIKTNTQMEAEGNHMDPRVGWNNLGQQIEKDPRKEDQFSKRKPIQSPRLSAEMSYGSMSTHYGAVSSGAPLGQVQREKSRVTPVPAAGRASSGTSLGNDPMQYQHQAQLAAKRRPNSLPRTPAISGVGSPVSLNNMGGPMNASSPSISTPQLTEHDMLERFAKIEVVAMRHQLNRKKNKVDEFSRKPRTFSAQELLIRLAGVDNDECTDDSREMSKSMLGGHMNVCKIRLVRVKPPQGNTTRLILSEKPNDGTVAMHYGDLNDEDYLNSEDHLPTLPNTHWADLLADQFCALVLREGYVVDEHLQLRKPRVTVPSDSQSTVPGGAPNHSTVDAQQYTESVEGQPVNSNNLLNSAANVLPSSGMLPPGNSQSLQMSRGHVPGVAIQARPQQMDPQQPLQQQPHQHQESPLQHVPSQFQRSPLMLPNNSMPQSNSFVQGSNLPVGNHMSNKSSPLQMLQQPNQLAQRRLMMGLGTAAMGMGQVGNNMGLGGLNNAMGTGGAKGMGSAGIPTGVGNMVQSPIGLSHANTIGAHLRAGTLSPQVFAAAQRYNNIMRSRGMLGGAQSSIAGGMSAGTRQMQSGSAGLSMLGQSIINRGTIGQMQRSVAGQMAMPNLMQQQFQQLQQQPRQNVLPQQEATSPLQSMVSTQQVSSPSTMGHPQQMNQQLTATPQQQASPQQMSQRGPMSPPLSSGPVHPMSADACPASPALSSQTVGSVGNIPHSPMDLHGVNKSNSATNT